MACTLMLLVMLILYGSHFVLRGLAVSADTHIGYIEKQGPLDVPIYNGGKLWGEVQLTCCTTVDRVPSRQPLQP